MIKKIFFLIILLGVFKGDATMSWELYDRVLAVVNNTPIIESEVDLKFERLLKFKSVSKNRMTYEKSRMLDKFIEDAILVQVADEESIIVSDKKIDNHIEKVMKRMGVAKIEDFKSSIVKMEKMTYEEYREELKISLIREQVISIAVGVTPPSTKEAMDWFKENSGKVGYQVNIKHILIRPKDGSFAEEKRVNKLMNQLRDRIMAGESFEAVAAKYSEDTATAKNGGNLGWSLLEDLDPYLASGVYRMSRAGQISQAIKSGQGYHLVKYLGRRSTPYEAIKDKIFMLLYNKKMAVQYQKWVSQKMRESDIKIYMNDYKQA
jgi:peptidyl-prolyl cis-trans isomerase SurA